jgi:hypothetical protein
MEMKDQLERLVKLAKAWRDFSREAYGWVTIVHERGNLSVWCYFADDGNYTYTAVCFNWKGKIKDRVDVSLHDKPQVNSSIDGFMNLSATIDDYEALLATMRAEFEAGGEQGKADARAKEIAALKTRLSELEAQS